VFGLGSRRDGIDSFHFCSLLWDEDVSVLCLVKGTRTETPRCVFGSRFPRCVFCVLLKVSVFG